MNTPFAHGEIFAGKRLHLGISGSVACYKACDLLRRLLALKVNVSCVLSPGARHFITPLLMEALGASPVYGEMFGGDGALDHLEPGRNDDALAIVPASANTLAKLASGMADNMLTAQFLAFPGPKLIAPAMNPRMWANGATQENVSRLRARGCRVVAPGIGTTACGERGQGRLADIAEIFFAVLAALSPCPDLEGTRALVTLGPTREKWDGVRFWSNPSTGRMGAALATAAWLRGARVTAICGPEVTVAMPGDVERINVCSAKEMFTAARDIWPQANMGIFTAAVADFAPEPPKCADGKFKKDSLAGSELLIRMLQNPDILATLGHERRQGQKILGFAAEIAAGTGALPPFARLKLIKKGADIIAANCVNNVDGVAGAFGAEAVALAVVDRSGREEIWPPLPKSDAAWRLLTWLSQL